MLDDLTVICEELLERRPQPATGLPSMVVRVPFDRSPARDGTGPLRAGLGRGTCGPTGEG